MQERTALEERLTSIGRIEQELEDQVTMIELGEAERDQKTVAEAQTALEKLRAQVARSETEALLSGEADANDSYLEVHAGAARPQRINPHVRFLDVDLDAIVDHGVDVDARKRRVAARICVEG